MVGCNVGPSSAKQNSTQNSDIICLSRIITEQINTNTTKSPLVHQTLAKTCWEKSKTSPTLIQVFSVVLVLLPIKLTLQFCYSWCSWWLLRSCNFQMTGRFSCWLSCLTTSEAASNYSKAADWFKSIAWDLTWSHEVITWSVPRPYLARSNAQIKQCWSDMNQGLLPHCQFCPQMFPEAQFGKLFRSSTRFSLPGIFFLLENNQAPPQLSYVGLPFVTCFVTLNGWLLSLFSLVSIKYIQEMAFRKSLMIHSKSPEPLVKVDQSSRIPSQVVRSCVVALIDCRLWLF